MQRVAFMYIVRLGDVMPSSLHTCTCAGPMRQVYDKSYYMCLLRWLWCVFTGYGGACDVLLPVWAWFSFLSYPIGNLSIHVCGGFIMIVVWGKEFSHLLSIIPHTVLPLYFPTVAPFYVHVPTYVCHHLTSLLLPTSLWPLSLSLMSPEVKPRSWVWRYLDSLRK